MATITFPLIFGVLPSILWLIFYLREDVHPEPKKMVILVFLLGIVSAFLAAFFECLPIGLSEEGKLKCLLPSIFAKFFSHPINYFLYSLFGVALIEEFAKYLVIRLKVLKHPEFDEPTDVILYMIIAALGFAAIENIFLLFSLKPPNIFNQIIAISIARFLSAIFLHALASATIGFFLALSFLERKKKNLYLFIGFSIAIFLHGLYDFSIIEGGGNLKFLIPLSILTFLSIFISFCFKRLKKLKSICKL